MNTEHAFETLGRLELTDDEVRGVLIRHAAPRRRRAAVAALAFAAAGLIAVLVPQSRAELTDALRAALHGGSLPGRTVPAAELPGWLRQVPFAEQGEPRVLAEADGERMIVFRQESGALCFEFGGVGICDWQEEHLFADGPVALFGPTVPHDGRFRLWGLTLATVERVEVRFGDGTVERVRANGGFGIALDPDSEPQTLVAYGAGGRELATIDLRERWERRPGL
jgi:hypothetical protein